MLSQVVVRVGGIKPRDARLIVVFGDAGIFQFDGWFGNFRVILELIGRGPEVVNFRETEQVRPGVEDDGVHVKSPVRTPGIIL